MTTLADLGYTHDTCTNHAIRLGANFDTVWSTVTVDGERLFPTEVSAEIAGGGEDMWFECLECAVDDCTPEDAWEDGFMQNLEVPFPLRSNADMYIEYGGYTADDVAGEDRCYCGAPVYSYEPNVYVYYGINVCPDGAVELFEDKLYADGSWNEVGCSAGC